MLEGNAASAGNTAKSLKYAYSQRLSAKISTIRPRPMAKLCLVRQSPKALCRLLSDSFEEPGEKMKKLAFKFQNTSDVINLSNQHIYINLLRTE